MNCRLVLATIGAICLVSLAPQVASGQSTQLDSPEPVRSREVVVNVMKTVTHYFTFEAGPGDFSILAAAQMDGGVFTNGAIQFDTIDESGNHVGPYLSAPGFFGINEESQKMTQLSSKKKVKIILKVSAGPFTSRQGATFYRFKLGGAVSIDESRPRQTYP